MPFTVSNYPEESPYIERWNVTSTSPLIIIKGRADPGQATSKAVWKVWKETYDANGVFALKLFMNGSNKFDQILDNSASAVYS